MMFHDIQQNTDEWMDLRLGKITGSAVSSIMANFGKAFGQPAKDYAVKIALEQITGKQSSESYSNVHMERGHEQEPIARALYEEETFCEVLNGGFYDNGITGCSPDGNIYHNGLLEIKSVISKVQFATIKRGNFDPKYKWQLCFNLVESDREWIDYVSFCADFPQGKKLFIKRIYREDMREDIGDMLSRVSLFLPMIGGARKLILEQ